MPAIKIMISCSPYMLWNARYCNFSSNEIFNLPGSVKANCSRNGMPLFRLNSVKAARGEKDAVAESKYKPGPLDNVFMSLFRRKMVQEVGWNSEKAGYDGLIQVANHLMLKYNNKLETEEATVRILRSLFPPFILLLFRMLIAPLAGGKPAAIMTARVTAATCQWLMGRSTVNLIYLSDGSSCNSGVLVERCRYLEESKCVGICIHTCKLPTQRFIKENMGIPLSMEPNFSDFSCQFKFGVDALPSCDDKALQVPCLEICPNDTKHKRFQKAKDIEQCPKV